MIIFMESLEMKMELYFYQDINLLIADSQQWNRNEKYFPTYINSGSLLFGWL